jgi:hypothetical protein
MGFPIPYMTPTPQRREYTTTYTTPQGQFIWIVCMYRSVTNEIELIFALVVKLRKKLSILVFKVSENCNMKTVWSQKYNNQLLAPKDKLALLVKNYPPESGKVYIFLCLRAAKRGHKKRFLGLHSQLFLSPSLSGRIHLLGWVVQTDLAFYFMPGAQQQM